MEDFDDHSQVSPDDPQDHSESQESGGLMAVLMSRQIQFGSGLVSENEDIHMATVLEESAEDISDDHYTASQSQPY